MKFFFPGNRMFVNRVENILFKGCSYGMMSSNMIVGIPGRIIFFFFFEMKYVQSLELIRYQRMMMVRK